MNVEDWKTAGKIAAQALEFGRKLVKKDALLLDVADQIEAKIRELGAEPGFPVNISLNETAAHDTPKPNDERRFTDELVKLDVGTVYNGAIGDTACTIDLSGKHARLVKASEEALANALKMMKPGTEIGTIGKEIEQTIKKHGFEPIKNLSGHEMKEHELHTGLSIPNYASGDRRLLMKGQVFAVEPFATDGTGLVQETGHAEIFNLVFTKPMRDPTARKILQKMQSFEGLPFTTRWFNFPLFKVNVALKTMNSQDMLKLYPPLVEQKKGLVSQAEHSVLIDDEPIVLTKI